MKQELIKEIYNQKKNLIITGDIAIGKTKNVSIPLVCEMIKNNESLFVLDSKEEYLNYFYQELKNKNYNIIIINLKNPEKSEGWNPLLHAYKLYKKNKKDRSLEYLERFYNNITFEESNDPFWMQSAASLLVGATLGLFEDATREEINLNSVYNIINDLDTFKNYIDTKNKLSSIDIYTSEILSSPLSTQIGILSLAKQKLKPFVSRETLSNLLNETTYNEQDILNKPTAIIFIAKDEANNQNILESAYIEELYNILSNIKYKYKFNFVLDNFDTIPNLINLKEMLSSCISKNIKFLITTRSYKGLTEKYSNYISKLINTIKVKTKTIEIIIDNESTLLDNENKEISIERANIKMPHINKKPIMLFNIDEYKRILDLPLRNKVIDGLKEIESSLKKPKEEKKQIISELQQFKIKE